MCKGGTRAPRERERHGTACIPRQRLRRKRPDGRMALSVLRVLSLLCGLRPAACKAFHGAQWRKCETQTPRFSGRAPAGRRRGPHFSCEPSRLNLQYRNATAIDTGARRDGSGREFRLESIAVLAAAIHSVKPRRHPAKRERLCLRPRRCNSQSN